MVKLMNLIQIMESWSVKMILMTVVSSKKAAISITVKAVGSI